MHALATGVLVQATALAKPEELRDSGPLALRRQFAARRFQSRAIAADQFARPVEIWAAAECALQRANQRIVVEPVSLVAAEGLEGRPQVGACAGKEAAPGSADQSLLERDNRGIVDRGGRWHAFRALVTTEQP